jgi:heme-degrading monooxygenase HmoA
MFAVMRSYKVKSDEMARIEREVRDGFASLIRQASGFDQYFFIRTSADSFTTISVFDDQESAQASVRLAADWVRRTLGDLTIGAPEIRMGPVSCEAHRAMLGEPANTGAQLGAWH